MTGQDANLLRQIKRRREAGDLPGAAAMLCEIDPATDPQAGFLQLRFLFELQDYAGLQRVTRAQLAAMTPDLAATASTQWLANLLRFAERCCLPPAEIARGLVVTEAAAMQDPALLLAWQAVQRRQSSREALADRYDGGVSLISLGTNCLPWHLPGRWGLRRMADFTELFGPFALAGHTIPGMIAALEDDFANYGTPEAMRIVTTQRGHDMAMRKDRGAHWNHNRGPYWLRDEAAPLRASLTAKADLFRAACRRPDAVFLISGCQVEYPEEPLHFLPRLDAALARFTGHEGNRILVTNQSARRRPAGSHHLDATSTFAYCPFPSAGYVWHDDAVADSAEGLAFEIGFMTILIENLLRWGLLRPLPAMA